MGKKESLINIMVIVGRIMAPPRCQALVTENYVTFHVKEDNTDIIRLTTLKWEFILDYQSVLNTIMKVLIKESQGVQSQLRSCEGGSTGCSYTETRAKDCDGL